MDDFEKYLEGKNWEELREIQLSLDKNQYPDRFQLVQDKLDQLNSEMIAPYEEKSIPESPGSVSAHPAIHQREFANVFTRFGAIIIDGLLLVPFYIPLYLAGRNMEYGIEPPDYYYGMIIITSIAMFIFAIWNTIVRMGKTGQSLGRKFLNIAVLKATGEPIGIGKAALREIIGRWISGLVCYIGYLNAFWDKHKQMWHDKIANCYVYYVDENFS